MAQETVRERERGDGERGREREGDGGVLDLPSLMRLLPKRKT